MSVSLPGSKTASLICTIAEFQRDINQSKNSRIELSLQALVNFFAPFSLLELALPKHQTRVVKNLLPSYDINWLTNVNSYLDTIAFFPELTSNMPPPTMDPVIQHSIFSAIRTIIAIAMTFMETKHKKEIVALWEMIEKFFFFK